MPHFLRIVIQTSNPSDKLRRAVRGIIFAVVTASIICHATVWALFMHDRGWAGMRPGPTRPPPQRTDIWGIAYMHARAWSCLRTLSLTPSPNRLLCLIAQTRYPGSPRYRMQWGSAP